MIRRGLNLTLALAVLIVSTPHALCMCKPVSETKTGVVRKCPHCRPIAPAPGGCPVKSCKCGTCEVIPSVPPAEVVAAPRPSDSSIQGPAIEALPAFQTACLAHEEGWAAGPPVLSMTAGRAIPIFLGHLLI